MKPFLNSNKQKKAPQRAQSTLGIRNYITVTHISMIQNAIWKE